MREVQEGHSRGVGGSVREIIKAMPTQMFSLNVTRIVKLRLYTSLVMNPTIKVGFIFAITQAIIKNMLTPTKGEYKWLTLRH